MTAENSKYSAIGDAAGDQAGAAFDTIDLDNDGLEDIVIGAPGTDANGSGSGSIYLVPAP